jgi:hypothetical protein
MCKILETKNIERSKINTNKVCKINLFRKINFEEIFIILVSLVKMVESGALQWRTPSL